jgi:hypothetical protein
VKLNQNILSQLNDFGHDLEGFTESYAVDGLVMAQGFVAGTRNSEGHFVAGIGVEDERSVWLMALDLTWLLWLDDRIDIGTASVPCIDWDSLLQPQAPSLTSVEGRSFSRICAHMAKAAPTPAAFAAWQDSAVALLSAYHANWRLSAGRLSWGYAEYLENGEVSIALPHFLATVSLACDYRMELRGDPLFRRIVRNLSLASRLQNDLASAEKERSVGDRANAVLLIERYTTPCQAREFVLAEQLSYEKMLLANLQSLDPSDPMIQFSTIILAMMDVFYKAPRKRYMP